MKKIVFVLLAVLAMGAARAQKFEIGARAGLSSQNMDLPSDYQDAKARLGWHLAAVGRIRLVGFGDGLLGAGLFLQPEVVYTQNNIKAKQISTSSTTAKSRKFTMKSIDVPILLSAKVSIARINAGPVFNLMGNLDSSDGSMKLESRRSTVGFILGAGVKVLGMEWDVRYLGDFKKMTFKGDDSWKDVRSRFSSWSVGVGMMF